MSSGHAISPRSPRDSYPSSRGAYPHNARYNGDQQRPRSRSRSPERRRRSTNRARRGNHFRGRHSVREPEPELGPDPESYFGTRGRSYRPNYDRSPIRSVSPRQTSDRESPQPSRSIHTLSTTIEKGDIIIAKHDQRKDHEATLRVYKGDRLEILNLVSGNYYRCVNVESSITGQVHSRVFRESSEQQAKPPEGESKRVQNIFEIQSPNAPKTSAISTSQMEGVETTEQPPPEVPAISEDAHRKINEETIHTLKDIFSKISEASMQTIYAKLQRDAAEELFETRTADFNKSKEHHEKFPPLKETQNRQRSEAQKKFAALDQKLKDRNEALECLITNAVKKIVPMMIVEISQDQPDFERQLTDIQRNYDGLKLLVENQANLLGDIQNRADANNAEDIKILKTDIIEAKRHADTIINLHEGLSNQVQSLVANEKASDLRQRIDNLEGLKSQVESLVSNEKASGLRQRIDNLEKLSGQVQSLVANEKASDLRQRIDNLEGLKSQVESLVANEKASDLSQRIEGLKNQVQNLVANEKASDLHQRIDNLERLSGQVQSLSTNEEVMRDSLTQLGNRITAAEEDQAAILNISTRVGKLETNISGHDEVISKQQKGICDLVDAGVKNVTSFKVTTDRLEKIEKEIGLIWERINALEVKASSDHLHGQPKHAGETSAISLDIDIRLKNLEAMLPEFQNKIKSLQMALNTVSTVVQGIESRVGTHLNQSNKTVTEVNQLVAAVDHGLGNLRSRVDNIYTSDLAKAMLDQVQFVYPNLKATNESVNNLKNQFSKIAQDISELRETQSSTDASDLRHSIEVLQHDCRMDGDRAVNQVLTEFITQYNMDYSTTMDGIANLKSQSVERQSEQKALSTKVREVEMAINLAKVADERITSLKEEMMKSDMYIKEKLELPLKQITKISMELKEMKEQKGKVNDLTNRIEKLERRRPAPAASPSAFSTKGASKKRSMNGGSPSAKRRNTVENDKDTVYMPANQEENLWGPTIEDSERE